MTIKVTKMISTLSVLVFLEKLKKIRAEREWRKHKTEELTEKKLNILKCFKFQHHDNDLIKYFDMKLSQRSGAYITDLGGFFL